MSREQINAALAKANATRMRRAELKARVAPLDYVDGRYELAAIIREQHDELGTVPVASLLRWVKHMRPAIVDALLRDVECSEFKTVRDLSERQFEALARALCSESAELRARAVDRDVERWALEHNRDAA